MIDGSREGQWRGGQRKPSLFDRPSSPNPPRSIPLKIIIDQSKLTHRPVMRATPSPLYT